MPQFPFRRSVGDDLRSLFRADRLATPAHRLGYSSISPGEGAAEVRDAAGATVAQFGNDDVGGSSKQGFLVPDGSGGWQTVQEHAAAAVAAGTASLTSRIADAEGRLNSHASRIGTAEGRLNSHASRIGAAEGDISTHTGRLDAHVIRIGRNENEIQKLIDYANSLNARVSELEGDGIKPGLPPNQKG